jgi:hypothetical protein
VGQFIDEFIDEFNSRRWSLVGGNKLLGICHKGYILSLDPPSHSLLLGFLAAMRYIVLLCNTLQLP